MRNQSKSQRSNISVNTAFWLVGGWQGNWAAVGETAANQFFFISPNSIHMPLLVHSVCLQGLKLGIIIWTWRPITVANGQIIIYIWVSHHNFPGKGDPRLVWIFLAKENSTIWKPTLIGDWFSTKTFEMRKTEFQSPLFSSTIFKIISNHSLIMYC